MACKSCNKNKSVKATKTNTTAPKVVNSTKTSTSSSGTKTQFYYNGQLYTKEN